MAHDATLAHSLKPRHVTMISIGGIIGAGIFVGSSTAIRIAGPAVLATYFLCGLLVFVIMRMLGEMAMARPGVGSFTGYTALGLGPWAGFTNAWLYYYFWVTTIAFEALAGADMLADMLPTVIHLPAAVLAAGLIAVMTGVNLLSVKTYGEFELWFASFKVVTIIGFITLGLAYIFGGNFGFGPGPGALAHQMTAHGGFAPQGFGAVFLAVPTVIFSMMGSEVATIAAVETEDPATNVVRSARTVALRIMFFYIGSIAVILAILPWNSAVEGQSPFVAALGLVHVPYAEQVIKAVVFTAIVSCLNSAIYVTSRMLYEMGQRGDGPAFFARTSSRKVPDRGILISALLGFAVVVTAIISRKGIYAFLLQSAGATILFVYLLIILSQIMLRSRLEAAGEVLPVKVWAFPYISGAAATGIIAVLVMMLVMKDQRTEVELSAGVFVLCVAIYALFIHRNRSGVPLPDAA
jgi:L-asparagine transporter-like permease